MPVNPTSYSSTIPVALKDIVTFCSTAVDGVCLRPTRMHPPPTDTSFNWWSYDPPHDFGPRLRGTTDDPYRDFNTGAIGFPLADVNKYYVLSHPEWDYDQFLTNTISSDDSLWMFPDRPVADSLTRGGNIGCLLSLGSFDLLPDSSARFVYSLFGADFGHVDPHNIENLVSPHHDMFYENLQLSVMRKCARDALDLSELVLDPLYPPTGLAVAYVNADTIRLRWDPRVFPDIIGYHLYLKPVESSTTIVPNVAALDAAPVDMGADRFHPYFALDTVVSPVSPVSPRYCGTTAGLPFCFYRMTAHDSVADDQFTYTDTRPDSLAWYWLTAVTRPGHESSYSEFVQTEIDQPHQKDILVIAGAQFPTLDYVIKDSLIDYYNRLLDGYSFDLYDWGDTNLYNHNCPSGYCTNWSDIADYQVILVQNFPAPIIAKESTENGYKLLTRIVESGRDLVYFGTPPGSTNLSIATAFNIIDHPPESFTNRRLGVAATSLRSWKGSYNRFGVNDSLGGFSAAVPVHDSLPYLQVDASAKRTHDFFNSLFTFHDHLPYTGILQPTANAEVLYRYRSAFPETSELKNGPCGLLKRQGNSIVYVFSFHLWGMEETGARALIDMIMKQQSHSPDPDLLPVTVRLHQNYPNPFNPTTTIEYDLGTPSRVRLEVYNILGQLVTTLVDEPQPAGAYYTRWYGRNDNKKAVGSGVDLYKLTTDLGTRTNKMILLK